MIPTLINIFFSKFKVFLLILRGEKRFSPSYILKVALVFKVRYIIYLKTP